MSKYLETKKGSIESAVLEAMSPAQQAAIAISKKEKEKNEELVDEDKAAYEKFFKSALKKFGVDSPADFKSDEEKKKFFDYVDKNYKGENEKAEEVKEQVSLAQLAAKHIADMWAESAGKKDVKVEETICEKCGKAHEGACKESTETTMTGKPAAKIEVNPVSKEDK
jgi:hypothetical protein